MSGEMFVLVPSGRKVVTSMERANLVVLLIVLMIAGDCDAMTKQQLKNSGKMLRKQCLTKTGVAEGIKTLHSQANLARQRNNFNETVPKLINVADKIAQIDKGKFLEEREVMCYIACIYQMTQVVKNNKLSYEASIKQVDMIYPQDMKDSVKATIENCKDVSKKYKDLCEASYWSAKCMYDDNPKDFIFP